jgi:hypothetical protein
MMACHRLRRCRTTGGTLWVPVDTGATRTGVVAPTPLRTHHISLMGPWRARSQILPPPFFPFPRCAKRRQTPSRLASLRVRPIRHTKAGNPGNPEYPNSHRHSQRASPPSAIRCQSPRAQQRFQAHRPSPARLAQKVLSMMLEKSLRPWRTPELVASLAPITRAPNRPRQDPGRQGGRRGRFAVGGAMSTGQEAGKKAKQLGRSSCCVRSRVRSGIRHHRKRAVGRATLSGSGNALA